MSRDYSKDFQNVPARRQLDERAVQGSLGEGDFNVWFSKWSGDGSKFLTGLEAATHRCILDRDAGRTRASRTQPFCIHFAHGKCVHGADCRFLHRIPMPTDQPETTYDCFGRSKFRTEREDMGGVGSFERRTKCLYVGGIDVNDHMEVVVRKHFGEWGKIEHVTIIQAKGVAFVRYEDLQNAEFAKEAMFAQALEGGEIVNVRWATDDPNPASIESVKRKKESDIIEGVRKRLPIVGDLGTILDYENSYKRIGPSRDKSAEGVNAHVAVEKRSFPKVITASMAYAVTSKGEDLPIELKVSIVAAYESSDDE